MAISDKHKHIQKVQTAKFLNTWQANWPNAPFFEEKQVPSAYSSELKPQEPSCYHTTHTYMKENSAFGILASSLVESFYCLNDPCGCCLPPTLVLVSSFNSKTHRNVHYVFIKSLRNTVHLQDWGPPSWRP
jgi:hypothetical protein